MSHCCERLLGMTVGMAFKSFDILRNSQHEKCKRKKLFLYK